MAFRKLFFKRVQGIRDTYLLQEGDIALDESDFKLYRGDGSTLGGIVISGAGGGSGIALTDISVTQASASGAGTLAYNSSTGVLTYTPPTASGLGAKTSVSQADVTQHQAALSITESQISDLGTYLTSVPAQTFASLTSKPTTIAGYGITDALELGTTSTTALAGDTALFDGVFASLTSKPTTIAGYGITDALALGTTSTTALAGNTSIPSVLTDLSISDGTNGQVLTTDGSGSFTFEDAGGGSSLQSRIIRTNQTTSLADGAEADLDITGFKAYALLSITTDKAARVRLYVKAASRTADASRAEGTDPTSDAGLIAEVITTGAETVIISPGAYGFNLENFTTTNIPCRVTNKSGSTDTVQVSLLVLQLES